MFQPLRLLSYHCKKIGVGFYFGRFVALAMALNKILRK
jgi:hypothetical protein